MKKILFLIIGFTVLSSCKTGLDMESDKNLTSIFSNEEVEDIGKMIGYVDQRVLDITGESDIIVAYKSFWEQEGKVTSSSERIVPFKDEEKYKFLESLGKSTFDSFFKFDTCFQSVKYRDTVFTNLCGIKSLRLSHHGKFMEYLSETGNTDSRICDLHDKLNVMGDVPAGAYQGFSGLYKDLDIAYPKWRLLSAFLVLRMEEPVETKIERYLGRKK